MTTHAAPRTRARTVRGLVWKRTDFRETSRLITLITAELGKLVTLGKGAHRPTSQCLGRIDFLNLVEVKISGGNLPILHRVRLLHEHRGLRVPGRFLAANYLTEIFDVAFPAGRSDPGLFDLLSGGLLLIERCPANVLPQILLGIELRFLDELGLRPPLLACSRCGSSLDAGRLFPSRGTPALLCQRHADQRRPAPAPALRWLDHVARSPGRSWPDLAPAPSGARTLIGDWVAAAVDRQPKLRAAAFRA